jgi:5-methylthioadenosine/S-adenosylhomocysteine deaminase
MDLLFRDATVLTGDDDYRAVREHCDVAIHGDRIEAIAPAIPPDRAARVIDARNLVLLPSLVNAHTHSPENLAKGRDDASTLAGWYEAIWPYLDDLPPRAAYVSVLLGAIEMIRTGTAAVVDHFRQTPMRADAVDAAIDAYADSGMRAVVAVMLRDRAVPAGRTVPWPAEQIGVVDAARARVAGDTRISVALGPSAPGRCTDPLLVAIRTLAEEHELLVHTHVDETKRDADQARAEHGRSSLQHLARLGMVNPSLSIAHGVWIDDADVRTLAASGAGVVHNPVSNMRLGSGIAPLAALLDAKVPVAIATDGAASNDGQNVLEAVKTALLLQRIAGVEPGRWIDSRRALAMATRVPARMFRFGTGRLAAGEQADLVGVSTSGYAFSPANDAVRQLVLGASGVAVRYTMAAGRLLLDDGRITTFDEPSILDEARTIASTLFASQPSR